MKCIISRLDLADEVIMEQETTTDASAATLTAPSEMDIDSTGASGVEAVTRYVVVNINQNLYGMSTESTVELMSSAIAQVTRVPHSPNFISGVINHRGTIIPVVDMRSLLGFKPRASEAEKLSKLFQGFKDDHAGWLNALQNSVALSVPFTGAESSTQCNFGKWYHTVLNGSTPISEMANEDTVLKSLIAQFDEPHRAIHDLAEKVLELKANGSGDEALKMIASTRETELADMNNLFDKVHKSISEQLDSMMVITEVGARKAAIAVDGVSFVVDCTDSSIEQLPDTADNVEFLSGLVHQSDGTYILITDLESIYNIACPKD